MNPRDKKSTLLFTALALACSLSWAATASASSPVTVLNPGFELPVTADGASSSAASWSLTGGADAGVWNPSVADYTAEAPEGLNVGYVYQSAANAGLSQVLSTNFQQDANYTLTVKVGYSKTYAYDGYKVQLLAGGVLLTGAEDDNSNPPAPDSFTTSTINYTYNVADAAQVGQPLEIRLLSKGLAGGETDFDDVKLTVTLGQPVAIAGGPYLVTTTGPLSLNGSASLPSDGQTLTTYEWDLDNDGDYDELITGATPASITYATLQSTYGMVDGANTIRLRVTDDSSPTPKTSVTTATVNLVGPPANDNFANAIDLTGVGSGQTGNLTSGTQTGTSSISASSEADEPALGSGGTKTVWFKWTSPGDGDFTYSTLGSTTSTSTEWDSVIGTYSGASLNALTPLGATPKDTGLAENMTIPVAMGTTYYIQLAGFNGQDAANILLTWSYTAQANILSFGPGAAVGTVVSNAADITWTVPFDSDLSALAPTFTLSTGASCTVDGNPVLSGATIDFSGGPRNYVVTSSDAAIVNTYTVTATLAPPPADGTWITDGSGNWSDTANWQDGTVADGRDKTAFFTQNITAARTVTIDAARSIGNITFTDSTTASHDLTISGANILTLDVTTGTPEINVTQTGNRQLTISSVISGSDGLKKVGPGILNLTGANTYTGTTTVTDGLLSFGAANINGMGGGTGSRDISVAASKIVQRTHSVLNAAFMNRLVETTDEFAICSTPSGPSDVGTGNVIDFSSSTNGANLPNAFFGSFATNGAQCRFNGTIIPASDAYRLGYPGTNGAVSMIQPLVDVGGTPRGLIVGGATPVLVANNTFTGDTVLRAGRLFLGRQLALQNSALNVGNGAGDGILGQICFLASNASGATQGELTNAPTLGGLIGARNLASIYNSANQNNTTRLAITAILGLTLDVDSGKTHTYSGNARLAPGMYLTKTGPGTQVLSGANDYTGATSVNQGTLALDGGSHASPITVASGASLGFTLGSPSTSTAALDLTNGTVKISGTVDNVSDYKLMTASTINGDPVLDSPIADYQLQKLAGDTELWLVHTGAASPYTTWASTNAPTGNPDDDYDGDGVSNAVEFVLGGLATSNDLGKLPTLATNGTNMTFTFTRDQSSIATSTVVTIEVGTNLSTWPDSYAVPDGAATNNPGVSVVKNSPADFDTVTLTVPQTAGAKFARLKVAILP